MSSQPDVQRIGTDDQGRAMLLTPYNESLAKQAVEKGLNEQTDSDPEQTTPDPASDGDATDGRDGGPIRRFNDVFTDLGSVQLEALALDGYEIARANRKFRDELFRNEFPLLIPRFTLRCEDCEAEYDEAVEACIECTRRHLIEEEIDPDPPRDLDQIDDEYHQGELRTPDPQQKREAEQLFESVNKEGQSLRDLYKLCEGDHARIGIGMHVVKWEYAVAAGDSNVFDRGEVIYQEVDELVKADPKRVVPVVDENGRIGGYWWACPIHRPPHEAGVVTKEPGHCEKCGAELQEVFYVEKEHAAAARTNPEKYYFDHEIVDWAFWYPRLNGKDGLSPVHHVWLKQSVLHWMDIYGSAFYDPNSDRYPNKFMVVHTTNPDAWERNFEKAEEDAKENPYSQQIMMNEYSSESQSTPEVQVIDLMNDELLGQDDTIKKRYKSDIRQQWDVSDVFDSELEDAGGLNNEGLQLEVTDRGIATRQHDLTTGPLDELTKLLGITDYQISFVPPQDEAAKDRLERVKLGQEADRAGLDPTWEDGEVDIPDGDFDVQESAEAGPGGFGGPPGADAGGEDGDVDEELFGDFSDGALEELATKLTEGYEHIVWAEDAAQKADPYWDEDETVPEFVQRALDEVIDRFDVVFDGLEGLTPMENRALEDLFKEKFTQPQGWSLDSIATDIQDLFNVTEDRAETWARTESARILNRTREEVYEAQPDTGEDGEPAKFKWIGPGSPDDGRTTDCCVWLKNKTDPAFGGEPRTLEELHELAREAARRFFPDLEYRDDWVLHPGERHTFTESFKAEVDDAPAVPGTFEKATAAEAAT